MSTNSSLTSRETSGAYSITSGPDVAIYTFVRLVIGILGIIFNSLLFFTFCINRAFHPNLKIIAAGLIFAMMIASVVTITQSVPVILSVKTADAGTLFFINSFSMIYAANLWQCILFTVAVERTVATIRNETYEANRKCYFGILLVISACLFSLLLDLNYFVFNFNMYGQIGLVFCINIVNIIAIIILFFVNKKLTPITIKSNIVLSQRYQVSENIKALHIFLPLVIAGIIGSALSLGLSTFQSLFDPIQSARTNGYSFVNSCFPIACFIIVFIQDPIMRNRTLYICGKRKFTKIETGSQLNLSHSSKNAIGHNLDTMNSPENHFAQLKSMWK